MSIHLPPIEVTRKDLLPRPAAVVQRQTNLESMDDFFQGMLPLVREAVALGGGTETGPPFIRYIDMAANVMEVQGGVPLLEPLPVGSHCKGIVLPAGPVVSVIHRGGYDNIADTHDALGLWLRAQQLRPAGTPWEVYWVSPLDGEEKQTWRTEIVLPVQPA